MNKTTKCLSKEEYELIISTLNYGYRDKSGIIHKPNEQLCYILICEANLGCRISDILNLTLNNFKIIDTRCIIRITEKKTKKERNYTCSMDFYNFLLEYCLIHQIGKFRKIFDIGERAVQKSLKQVCDYLGIEEVGSHSFRKMFATDIYMRSGYNLIFTQKMLLHSSPAITARYIGMQEEQLEEILKSNTNIPHVFRSE